MVCLWVAWSLGPSLDSVIETTKEGEFNPKTTLQIMDQVITRIQALHERQWIHRGIKPDNFCIGPIGSKSEDMVYLIDFDDAYKYISPYGNHSRDWGDNQGNWNWTSLAVDEGRQTIRWDDMESAGYMAVNFLKGWHGDSSRNSHSTMGSAEKDTSLDDLCKDVPQEFITYLAYCRSLEYTQQPDYDYCRRLFQQVFEREGFRDDGVYDWMAPQSAGESEKLIGQLSSDDVENSEQSEESCSSAGSGADTTVEHSLISQPETTEAGPSQCLGFKTRHVIRD
ncbi:hypothetical protein L198_05378 [Cryptococcus wingfieldii CBS 7118]|uniref:Protein kinase domain-containing protein n=1 Tax=Cryptococcus wingfieldii CBS 7118 TaxID=1295528 RepID=A0A1E3IY00_9TREE|nr:hypothetical protein L198_05378 [Cryptococcus wingfieldii CBS 7118]ODN93513.1 hypothetical protein L198_05378 [Cryptococcus wingfieldii CBS 7118]